MLDRITDLGAAQITDYCSLISTVHDTFWAMQKVISENKIHLHAIC
jgi:hypothetical protein